MSRVRLLKLTDVRVCRSKRGMCPLGGGQSQTIFFLPPMPKSEIDDIFSSKPKAKHSEAIAPSPSTSSVQKKKKKKQVADADQPAGHSVNPTTKKRSIPETVIDPSIQILAAKQPATKKRSAPQTVIDPSTRIPAAKRAKKIPSQKLPSDIAGKEAEEAFKDSRGSGPRTLLESAYTIPKLNFNRPKNG